jgi:4-diphosphocytidyl-2-C-methyl-D-erythritol kinase
MRRASAYAKINLGLVVGPLRADGKHEVLTVLQRVDVHDDLVLEPADELTVEGFAEDTIVRSALESLAVAARVAPRWRVRIEKRIPVAAGLGGGSSDAATALRLANAGLSAPLDMRALHGVAATVGTDVPFFLCTGAQVASGDGTELSAAELPVDYHVVLVVPHAETKLSTAPAYEAFDERCGANGFPERAAEFHRALQSIADARDLARLPANDLASSAISRELAAAGAFRADVSGAGPVVYGLFDQADDAAEAASGLAHAGRTILTRPLQAVDLA